MDDKFFGMISGYISGCQGKRSLCCRLKPLALISDEKLWLIQFVLNDSAKSFTDYITVITKYAHSLPDKNAIKYSIYLAVFDTLIDNSAKNPAHGNVSSNIYYWIYKGFLLLHSGKSITDIFYILRINNVHNEIICIVGALLGAYLGYNKLIQDGIALSSDNLMFAGKQYIKYTKQY
jgi:hypothetical protein